MFNLLTYSILSAPLWTIHLHMDDGGYLLGSVSVVPLIWPIIFHWVHLQTLITRSFQWPWQSEVKINRSRCFYFFSNPYRSLLFPGINPALILLSLTKDYWALSSRWQKEMAIKVEEQIYLISSLIIWSIYQPFSAPVLCVTQTYWRIEGYCRMNIKEFNCYCLAKSKGLVLKQYHLSKVFFFFFWENNSLTINKAFL